MVKTSWEMTPWSRLKVEFYFACQSRNSSYIWGYFATGYTGFCTLPWRMHIPLYIIDYFINIDLYSLGLFILHFYI